MKLHFRPALTAATALGLAALIALGLWQLDRLRWKEALIAQVEQRVGAPPIPFDEAVARAGAGEAMEYAPVTLAGVYAHDLEAHVFGTLGGAPGVYVFTPLDAPGPEGGGRRFVYVNRGFVPQALRDPAARSEGAPTGEVTVTGLLRAAETPPAIAGLFRPADQPGDNLWFARDPARLAAHHGIQTPRWYIDSSGAENPGAWPKGGTTRVAFPNNHLDYALTWFGLALALLVIYAALSLRRR